MEVFGIGTNEIVIILLLAVLVLGPERLTRLARDLRRFARGAKSYYESFSRELRAELDILDDIQKIRVNC